MLWKCAKCQLEILIEEHEFPIHCVCGNIGYNKNIQQNISNQCTHLGKYLGKQELCLTCCRKTKFKVFACDIHKECVPTRKIVNIASCIDCKDYKCLKCDFNAEGICKNCGFKVDNYSGIPTTRDCRPSSNMAVFETRDGNPAFIANHFKDQKCFYVGCGPSLLQQDLSKLNQRGIITLAVNNVAAKTFRPNLWVAVDDVRSFHQSIWDDPAIMKFIPQNRSGNHYYIDEANAGRAALYAPNIFLFEDNLKFNTETYLEEKTISWGSEKGRKDNLGYSGGRSVILAALKVLYVLGFKEVYLLGCDFHMQHDDENKKGKGFTYAFSQYKHRGGCATNNSCYEILDRRFKALDPIFKKNNFHVFNSTPNSRLKAFDFLPYDQALVRALEKFPKKITTFGYYGGKENLNRFGW